MSQIQGLDISAYQEPPLDFHKVHANNKDFVFFKVNEGTLRDKHTNSNRVGRARKAGLRVGGYDFLYPRPGRTGGQEFDIFYDYAKDAGLLRKGDLVPVADVERLGAYANTIRGRYLVRRYVKTWVDRCVKRTGQHPDIYTGAWFYDDILHATSDYGCRLWVADYSPGAPRIPKAFKHGASFHQYSEKGHVAGIDGPVDLDVYLSDTAHLIKNHTLKINV